MAPLPDFEQRISTSMQVKKYATDIDRESAREKLAARVAPAAGAAAALPPENRGAEIAYDPAPAPPARKTTRTRVAKEPPGTLETVMKSPVARTVAGAITRGLMGALLGTPRRRKRTGLW